MLNSGLNGFYGIPMVAGVVNDLTDTSDVNLKQAHDQYDVYVNGDYVGKKVLVAQSEKIEDVERYLKNNGYHHFKVIVEGDHYMIKTEDAESSARIKENLNSYLLTR